MMYLQTALNKLKNEGPSRQKSAVHAYERAMQRDSLVALVNEFVGSDEVEYIKLREDQTLWLK